MYEVEKVRADQTPLQASLENREVEQGREFGQIVSIP